MWLSREKSQHLSFLAWSSVFSLSHSPSKTHRLTHTDLHTHTWNYMSGCCLVLNEMWSMFLANWINKRYFLEGKFTGYFLELFRSLVFFFSVLILFIRHVWQFHMSSKSKLNHLNELIPNCKSDCFGLPSSLLGIHGAKRCSYQEGSGFFS